MRTTRRQTIFIMTDTQGADMVSCYGASPAQTPCIDKLASEGARFEYAYTCQPVCGPARSAIFTGSFPHTNASWGNTMPLGDSVKTIGQRMSDQGIHCAYIGKWHLDAGDYFGEGRCADGWDPDYWYDMRNYLDELTEEERARSRTFHTCPPKFTFGYRCTQRAIDFIEKHKDEDFLLVVSYDEPHHPFLCPPEFLEIYKDKPLPPKENRGDTLEDKPAHQRVWAGAELRQDAAQRAAMTVGKASYLGCNSFIDHEIGRVVDAVDANADDAMVIYTSDHGDAAGAHRIGGKGPCLYDEVARIPYMYRCKGVIPADTVLSEPGSHIDIVPSIMDYMGCDPADALEGRSLMPTLRDPAVRTNEYVFTEYHRYEVDHDGFGGFQPMKGVFDGRYKLVVNLLSDDELYDMREDPQEMVNLISSAEHVELRNRLHDVLLDWMNGTRDPFRGYYWQRRPWRTDAPDATWDCAGMTRQRLPDGYHVQQLDYNTGLPIREFTRPK